MKKIIFYNKNRKLMKKNYNFMKKSKILLKII